MEESTQGRKMRRGLIVFLALAVVAAVEFWVAVTFTGVLAALALMAAIKAWLIINYFMYISRSWLHEE